jgi:hypothetical protein
MNGMRLLHGISCRLCEQIIDSDKRNSLYAYLFGAVAYALCPLCGLETDPDDLDWRKKVDKFQGRTPQTKNNWYLLSEYPDDVEGRKEAS